ncbi:MAG: hypothetical protein ACK5LR_08255 [Mangrovibacterium sp.]
MSDMLEAIFSTIPDHPSQDSSGAKPSVPPPSALSGANAQPPKPEEVLSSAPALKGATRTLRRKPVSVANVGGQASPQEAAKADSAVDVVAQAQSHGQEEKLHEPIDQEVLNKIWEGFLSKLGARPALKSAMSHMPQVKGDMLRLEVSSKIGEEEIGKIKPDLLGYLKKRLRNSYLDLQTEVIVVENAQGTRRMPNEILEMMKNKNAHLHTFIDQLGLHLEG